MSANTTGTLFRLTTFGESHGVAVGGVIDGCPAGLRIDIDFVQQELNKRKPAQLPHASERKEDDKIEVLSGIFDGKSTAMPIAFIIRNTDCRSTDYIDLANAYRPSHADYTYDTKYGFRDYKGGGRSSARETVSRVAGGAFAKLFLKHSGIKIKAYVSGIGTIEVKKIYSLTELEKLGYGDFNCPDVAASLQMADFLASLKERGDTAGGTISCIISGVPAGLGEPVFDKLQANLAKAMMNINAAKGFEYGEGFNAAKMLGSQHNDSFFCENNCVKTKTNHSGGIQGGISNAEDIYFKVAFKPVATLKMPQQTINKQNENIVLQMQGRHDTCVVPRAVAIVEAMAALTLADFVLLNRCSKL